MQGFTIVIDPDGSKTVRKYRGTIPLGDLRAGVGDGLIEHVPYFDSFKWRGKRTRCVAFCNEEGKLHGMLINEVATRIWHEGAPVMRGRDVLVGPVVIVFGDEAFMRAL
jgi:hypothetical protein